MRDMLLRMAVEAVNAYMIPSLKEYVAKTPGKLDDLIVDAVSSVLKDPNFLDILKLKM